MSPPVGKKENNLVAACRRKGYRSCGYGMDHLSLAPPVIVHALSATGRRGRNMKNPQSFRLNPSNPWLLRLDHEEDNTKEAESPSRLELRILE
jgi:hypothetical protein